MKLFRAFLILLAFSSSILFFLILCATLIGNLPPPNKHQIKGHFRAGNSKSFPHQQHALNPHPPWAPPQRPPLFTCPIKDFPFKSSFHFPQPLIMKHLSEIDSSPFLCELRQFLSRYESDRPLALITSNSLYQDVLLNWLISATVRSKLPLESILVLSLNSSLHRALTTREIPSVLVTPSDLFRRDVTFKEMFESIMMVRLAMMRIISHFGFDVVMYDTDAIMLRDPQPLYDRLYGEDIIGSVGKIPVDLNTEWGLTICIGVVLVKSSTRTETYWNSMHRVCPEVVDDQGKLNCGLKALSIHWANNDSNYQNTTVHGVCENGLRVSILHYDYICRQTNCDPAKKGQYYIWHKGGQRSRREKLDGARVGRTWFLRSKWQFIFNNLRGVEWLESICYQGATHE